MSTIRYCIFRDTDVIIAPKRLHRPTQFETLKDNYTIDECPFEPGSEDSTPDEIYSLRDENGEWICRVIPNLYNALDIGKKNESKREGFFTTKSGFGAHEVIIENPSHDKTADKYTLKQWDAYLDAVTHRYEDLAKDVRLEYIQIFKNHGSRAGATLRHPHSQIIATGFIPTKIEAELARYRDYYEKNRRTLLFDVASEELRLRERVVYENNSFVAFVPFAALYPFELFIVPKESVSDITKFYKHQLHDLSQVLQHVYKKLYAVLGDFAYNMIFKNLPPKADDEDCYTFHIQIIPRIYTLAGFELSSGLRINPVTPEIAAEKLKEVS